MSMSASQDVVRSPSAGSRQERKRGGSYFSISESGSDLTTDLTGDITGGEQTSVWPATAAVPGGQTNPTSDNRIT